MLRWALIFLIIALVAALFGFTGIAAAVAGVAKFLSFLFLVASLMFFGIGISAGRKVSESINEPVWDEEDLDGPKMET